jgi:hypothetical protein
VLEDEQKLGELVERVEAVPERGAVAVLREDPIAIAVNRRGGQLRQVTAVCDCPRRGRQTIAHLEGRFLGERAQHYLPGFRLVQEQQVQCP